MESAIEEGPLDWTLTLPRPTTGGGAILGTTTALKVPLAGSLVAEEGIEMLSSMSSESGISRDWASLEALRRVLVDVEASGVCHRDAEKSEIVCED